MIDPGSALAELKQFREIKQELAKFTPDAKVKKEYGEILEEVLLENNALIRALPETLYQAAVRTLHALFPTWEGDPDHFSPHDVVDALRELFTEGVRAGTNRKREILERAFFSRFRPDFYKSGESRLLWDIVRRLEYPQIWALRELIGLYESSKREMPKHFYGLLTVKRAMPASSHLKALGELGLLREKSHNENWTQVYLMEMAFRLREFVWAREWPEPEE